MSVAIPRPPSERPPAPLSDDRWDVSDDAPGVDSFAQTHAKTPSIHPPKATIAPSVAPSVASIPEPDVRVTPSSVGNIQQSRPANPLRATMALTPARALSQPPTTPPTSTTPVIGPTAPLSTAPTPSPTGTVTMSANVAKTLVANAIRESGSTHNTLMQTQAQTEAQNPATDSTPQAGATAPSSAGVVGAKRAANPLTSTMLMTPSSAPKAPSSAGVSEQRRDVGTSTLLHAPTLSSPPSTPPAVTEGPTPSGAKVGATTLVQHGPASQPPAPSKPQSTESRKDSAPTAPASAGSFGIKTATNASLRSTLVGNVDLLHLGASAPAPSKSMVAEINEEGEIDSTRPFSAKYLQDAASAPPSVGRIVPQTAAPGMTLGRVTTKSEPLAESPAKNLSAQTLLHSSPLGQTPVMTPPSQSAEQVEIAQPPHGANEFDSLASSAKNNITLTEGSSRSADEYETSNQTDANLSVLPSSIPPRALAATMVASAQPLPPRTPPQGMPPQGANTPAISAHAHENARESAQQSPAVRAPASAQPSSPSRAAASTPPQSARPSARVSERPSARPNSRATTSTDVLEPAHNALRILLGLSGLTLIGTAIPTAMHTPIGAATAAIPGLTALLMALLPMGYATRALLAFAPALPAIAVYAMGNGSHALAPALMLTALCALWPAALLFRGYYPQAPRARLLLAAALFLGVGWSVLEGGGSAFHTAAGSTWLGSHVSVVALIPLLLWSFVLLIVRFSPLICSISALYAIGWALLPFWSQHPLTAIALSALSAITGASIATLCATYTAPAVLSATKPASKKSGK